MNVVTASIRRVAKFRAAPWAAVCVATLTLTACGGSSSSAKSAPAATTSGAGTSAPSKSSAASGSSGSGSATGAVNVCALLPASTVAKITAEPITIAMEDVTLDASKIYTCNYTSADGTSGLVITVKKQNAEIGYDADLQANGSGAHQVTGLGDKAFTGVTGLEAMFGSVAIQVSNLQSDSAAETLIRTIQPKL
jgi:hypothetical protein